MRLSERLEAAIPGFRGYKEKELRRESDKLIRNHLTSKLSQIEDNVKNIFQKITDKRYMDVLSDMDRLTAKMDRITGKVKFASYGYSGLFDVVKVKEENLDKMITFDNQLVDGVNGISADVDALKTKLLSGDTSNLKAQIQAITDKVDAFEDTFDKRSEVILGVN